MLHQSLVTWRMLCSAKYRELLVVMPHILALTTGGTWELGDIGNQDSGHQL